MQSAAFSATEMRLVEAIATLKPALYAPRLGAAGASVSRVQIMRYASGNLANFIVCGVFDWVALFLKKKKNPHQTRGCICTSV